RTSSIACIPTTCRWCRPRSTPRPRATAGRRSPTARGCPTTTMSGSRARCYREGSLLAVLLIDLDRFKDINDTLGHHVGDELLASVAARFATCTRTGDT